jgi:hypothetical protein
MDVGLSSVLVTGILSAAGIIITSILRYSPKWLRNGDGHYSPTRDEIKAAQIAALNERYAALEKTMVGLRGDVHQSIMGLREDVSQLRAEVMRLLQAVAKRND